MVAVLAASSNGCVQVFDSVFGWPGAVLAGLHLFPLSPSLDLRPTHLITTAASRFCCDCRVLMSETETDISVDLTSESVSAAGFAGDE